MHSRGWLVYAVIYLPALSAALPTASQSEDYHTGSPLNLISPKTASAGTTNTSLNDIPQHLSNYSAFPPNLPFGYDLPESTNAIPLCNGEVYGTGLDRHSCFDAWRNMGLEPQPASWGPRGPGHMFQYRLPYRWSSDDGRCVIDVVQSQYGSSDLASLLDIGNAAEQVMMKCIDPISAPATGGYVSNVGKHGRLSVVISKYTPDVVCGHDFTVPETRPPCRDTLSALAVSMQPISFGRQGLPSAQWSVPWTFQASSSRCTVIVDINSSVQRETMRWFDIWAAAVVADTMCIRRKKVGSSRHLGDHRYGWVALKVRNQPTRPPPLTVADE